MGFFEFFKRQDINEGVEAYRKEKQAVLVDVRTRQEYASGHIPKSHNLPLMEIDQMRKLVSDVNMPVYLYCLSGGRSQQAAVRLREMGYCNVHNIGGIGSYTGKLEV